MDAIALVIRNSITYTMNFLYCGKPAPKMTEATPDRSVPAMNSNMAIHTGGKRQRERVPISAAAVAPIRIWHAAIETGAATAAAPARYSGN
jgi:hypothetical protein